MRSQKNAAFFLTPSSSKRFRGPADASLQRCPRPANIQKKYSLWSDCGVAPPAVMIPQVTVCALSEDSSSSAALEPSKPAAARLNGSGVRKPSEVSFSELQDQRQSHKMPVCFFFHYHREEVFERDHPKLSRHWRTSRAEFVQLSSPLR